MSVVESLETGAGLKSPKRGKGLSDDDLVIAHADGSIVQPIYVSQQWARLIAKTSLARLRFHDLRNAHGTHLLANGVQGRERTATARSESRWPL